MSLLAFIGALLFILGTLCADAAPGSPPRTPYLWRSVPIGGGGYVLDVYCHPKQKNLVYIRTDVGGFYRWDAGGDRWIPLTDGFPQAQSNYYGGEGMALDPSDPNIVYIAAGKYTWASGTIFKSTDQGRTWRKLPIDLPMGGNEDHRWGGERLVVSPRRPRVLLFGSRKSGLWRSDNAGAAWAKVTAFPAKLDGTIGVSAVAFDPQTAGVVYAAAFGDGVYRSTDDGLTWARTPNGPARVERLACAADGTLYATHAGGVAQYTGGQWTDITPPGAKGGFGGLAVSPSDPRDVLAAEETDHLTLFRSRDGGRTWTPKTFTVQSSVPWYSSYMKQLPSLAGIAFDPCVAGRVWMTDWFATYETDDINASPILLKNHEHGHEELVAFSMAAPPGGPPLLSGTADVDGFVHTTLADFPAHGLGDYYGGTGPTFGDTDQFAWCAGQPNFVARVGVRRWNNTGGVALSHDGGRTWAASPAWDGSIMPGRIAISATDPNTRVVLRIGSGPALVTHDGGAHWAAVAGLPTSIDSSVWNWQVPLAADGAQAGVFYVYAQGKLFKSADGGATFAPLSTAMPGGANLLLSVPGRAGDLWLAAGGSGLYHSTDGGATFEKLPPVSSAPLFAIGLAAPGASYPALYVDGSLADGRTGIFRSVDAGQTWKEIDVPQEPVGDVPNCMAASFQTFGLVFIGTNGRGIYYGEALGKG